MDLFTEPAPALITLFDYQIEDRAKVAAGFIDKKMTRMLGVWPTGSGKTVLFSELHLDPRLAQWKAQFRMDQQKILVIAHTDELITQAVDKIQRSNPYLKIGIEKASFRADPYCDVVVASRQTLCSAGGKRLKKLNPDDYCYVVVDEAHHAASPSYFAIFQHFGFLPHPLFMQETRPDKQKGRAALLTWQRAKQDAWDLDYGPKNKFLLGVTATPKRGDNIGLECVFQDIVFSRTIREMIQRGRLCKVRAFRVHSKTSLDGVSTLAGDFKQDELAKAVDQTERNSVAVKAVLDYAPDRKGFTFCANVAHAQSMAEAYNSAGIPARAIHGKLKDHERKACFDDLASGVIRMLTTVQVLTEGVDVPEISVIVHCRPTQSESLYIQMTGRGLRVHTGKADCIIIDVIDITKKHSLITVPELFGLPADFDAKGGDCEAAKQAMEKAEEENPLADLSKVKNLDELELKVAEVDLLDSFSDDVLEAHADLGWVKTGDGYVVSWVGGLFNEFLSVRKTDEGQWQADLAIGKTKKWEKTFDGPDQAIKYAEGWLKKNVSHVHAMNLINTPNANEPASQAMKNSVGGLGLGINVDKLNKKTARQILNKSYYEKRAYHKK